MNALPQVEIKETLPLISTKTKNCFLPQIDEEVGKWSLPCVKVEDPFIIRDKTAYGDIENLEPLLDELDFILAVIKCYKTIK